jgi:hypothetical protein
MEKIGIFDNPPTGISTRLTSEEDSTSILLSCWRGEKMKGTARAKALS